MESMNILVADKSPETAERINSLLRNSVIRIHVLTAQKVLEVKRALDHDSPILVLYSNPDPTAASIEEICRMAGEYAVPFAIYSDFRHPDELIGAMKSVACLVIHSENEQQLTDTVKQLAARYQLNKSQQQLKSRLDELEHRYSLLLDSARDAIAYVHEGLHVYANRAYLETLRVKDSAQIEGLSLLELMQAEGVNLKNVLKGLSKGDFPQEPLQVTITRPDGSSLEAQLAFSPARFNGEPCTQMLVHERDAVAGLTAELEKLRVTDPLTDLRNKNFFTELLEAAVAKPHASDSVSAILYLEPDGLPSLQEELDTAAMDAVLADLARVLKSNLADQDEAARVSEYGFAVLTHQVNMERVEALSEQILRAYDEHLVEIGDRSMSVSCSIGIAMLGRLARSTAELLAGARKAQAEAAETGSRAVIFRPQLTAVSSFEDDRQWIDRIRFALSHQDFYSVQQNIINLEGDGDHLVENLTYLRDAAGDLAPQQFMEVADRNDLAGSIDRQIIPGLLKSVVESGDAQIITMSNNSILDYGFPAWLGEQIKEHCAEANRVIIQVSAQAAQTNLKPVQRLMNELAPMGCRLSISAFDSERRTQALLEHLAPAFIKIDRSLTESLSGNTDKQDALRKIVEAADSRGTCVIADEVSDTSSLAVLWQCGVKLIAGAFLKEQSQVVGE
jgi:diguanylate cyclase (GGDEF)-like protein